MRYENKVVVITGASAGLGRSMAKAFAREGARVAVIGTDSGRTYGAADEIRGEGGKAFPYLLDVADEAAVKATFGQIVADAGDIDILINNAAFAYGDIMSLMRINQEDLDKIVRVNLYGPLYCARAAHPAMVRRGGGVILNISSVSSYLPSGGYSLTKSALNNMTLALATELSGDNIRCNGIAPGRMASEKADNLPEALKSAFIHAQLVKRPGTEEDVVSMALFLAGSDASFISGQTIPVDGGFMAHAAKASVSPRPEA